MNNVYILSILTFLVVTGIFRIIYKDKYKMIVNEIQNIWNIMAISAVVTIGIWSIGFAIFGILDIALSVTAGSFNSSAKMFNNIDFNAMGSVFMNNTSVGRLLMTAGGLFIAFYFLYIRDTIKKYNRRMKDSISKNHLRMRK